MKKLLRKLAEFPYRLDRMERRMTDAMMLQAKAEVRFVRSLGQLRQLSEAEFKVFSQWGEDGIIQYLIHKLDIQHKSFVEFGVENYRESNTRFLLMNDQWRGLVLDGSAQHMATLRRDGLPWQYDLQFQDAFITKDNINDLIAGKGFSGPLGILSVDIDGNDYWVWQAIDCVAPDIVIAEYNAAFGPDRAISIPYKADFVASRAHYSRQYFGASLPALEHLATQKGYYLAGSTSAGNNAFFLHRKYISLVPPVSAAEAFVWPHWRQARTREGALSHQSFAASIKELAGLPVINVVTGAPEVI